MKTSVIHEAEYLPKRYRDPVIRLAFQAPDNPNRPAAHVFSWLNLVRWNSDFTAEDVKTVQRICMILYGEKVPPRTRPARKPLLARLFGL